MAQNDCNVTLKILMIIIKQLQMNQISVLNNPKRVDMPLSK